MTQEQVQFITQNQMHFGLVLDYGQKFQASHDITKQVLAIYKDITGKEADCCEDCIAEAYVEVWKAYQLNQPKAKK